MNLKLLPFSKGALMKKQLTKRKDGRYEAKVTIDGIRRSVYGRTKAEAHRNVEKLVQEVEQGKIISPTTSLHIAMERYLKEVKMKKVRPITYDKVESIFINQIASHKISRKSFAKITVEELQRLLDELSERYSRSTVKKVYDLLGEFYRYQIDTRKIDFNPMRIVRMPHPSNFKENKVMEVLTVEEFKRVLNVAAEKNEDGSQRFRYGEVIVLMLLTGLRSGEVRGIKLSDIDMDKGILHVKRSITYSKDRENGGIVYSADWTKTSSSKRDIPLNDRAMKAIRILAKTTYNPETDFLICTNAGKWLTHMMLQRTYDRVLKAAGLNHMGMHSTRHSFATIILKDAEDKGQIKEVSELLGHSRVSTTYDYYIGTSNEDKRSLVSSLDLLI